MSGEHELSESRIDAAQDQPDSKLPAAPEPSGPPQPVEKKPFMGCGCTGTAIALLLAGGVGFLLLSPTTTMGATRSLRIEREKRTVEIDRAWTEAHPAARCNGGPSPKGTERSR